MYQNILQQVLKTQVMKNLLQAAALILLAASAIATATVSHHKASEINKHEWEMSFVKTGNTAAVDSSVSYHK